MSGVIRVSFSIEESLWQRLEKLVNDGGYGNRSEFIRDLIRDKLVAEEWEKNDECVGTITLVYNHHARGLAEKLMDIQHHHNDVVVTTTHIHLDHDLCAETVVVRGRAGNIKAVADELRRQKGVLHSTLSISSTGKNLR